MCVKTINDVGTVIQICDHKYGSDFCENWKEI
jgi:hypothetical protein